MPFSIDNDVLIGIMLAILVMTLIFLINRSNRYFARQRARQSDIRDALAPRRESPRRESPQRESPQRETPPAGSADDLGRWEVQLHERARELCGQLDSKMAALQALCAEADRAAARLEAALRQAALPAPSGELRPASQADSLRAGMHAAEETAPRERGAERPKEEIHTLADYGFSPAEIAHRVGLPIGEVQLILSLRDTQ